jgi:DNA-binding HxlR family transcriptional regulator
MPPRRAPVTDVDPRNPPFKPIGEMVACPIAASLGVLGRKWALLVLRDIAFCGETTFSVILKLNPGMTARVLAKRLVELRQAGLIERRQGATKDGRQVLYRLTPQGKDVMPVLTSLIQYGIVHHANTVFEDKRPRELGDLYPGRQRAMLGRLARYARENDET